MSCRSRLLVAVVLVVPAVLGGCTSRPPGTPSESATRSYAEGVMAYSQGDIAGAKSHLVAATQESPELIRARILLGDLFRAEGNYKSALDEYETVVKLDPYSSSAFYRLGLAYQFLQRFLEAKDAYNRALELNDNDPDSHMNLGLVELALGDPEGAVVHTKRAVELAPSNPDALANYGVVLDVIGDHVGAQRAFLSSLEITGDKPSTLLNLASNLLSQTRPREAQEVLERFFKTSDSPIARKRMGDALALQGLAADAVEQYERALSLDPKYFPALNEAGRVIIQRYRAGNELDESLRKAALGYWSRSLAINPNQPTIKALQTQWAQSRP